MKKKTLLLLILLMLYAIVGISQNQTEVQLASEYFRSKEYDKAAELYENLFEHSHSKFYFQYYMRCLIELNDYKTAEKAVKKQIKRNKTDQSYVVNLGYLYKKQGMEDKAKKEYNEAIRNMNTNANAIHALANAFVSIGEYEHAASSYLEGRKQTGQSFRYELANVYSYQRNFDLMVEEYLALLDEDLKSLPQVQSRLQYYVANDIDGSLKGILKTNLIKRIQGISKNMVFNELLIWLYYQEQNFNSAFIQVKALDKRNKEDGSRMLELARLAKSNQKFDIAIKAYEYVVSKGREFPFYATARLEELSVYSQKVQEGHISSPTEIKALEERYLTVIEDFGRNKTTIDRIKDLAHLQAFFLSKPQEAIKLMESVIDLRNIPQSLLGECKLEYADILLYTGQIWEATLAYAQVEEANKHNPLGHLARFKKAKLAFYSGDFEWALAQLDVLKGSTSKLIANDAMQLSIVIKDNTMLDTNSVALQKYADAEFMIMRNMDSLAILTLDSILSEFPSHPLTDDVFFQKARIMKKEGNFEQAIAFYEKILATYPHGLWGDDALYQMGILYETNLKDPNKAMELYKRLMVDYSGSLFVIDARKRFRGLRGDFDPKSKQITPPTLGD